MLQAAYTRGRDGAFARFGVKIAGVPLARPMPAARGLATPHAAPAAAQAPKPGFTLSAAEEAQAARIKANPASGAQELGLDRDTQNHQFMQQHGISAQGPAAAAAKRPGAGRFMRPIKRGLGIAALGAGGVAALGMHQQNKHDEEKLPLVYTPMQGGFQ